jgi:hypothetical protein
MSGIMAKTATALSEAAINTIVFLMFMKAPSRENLLPLSFTMPESQQLVDRRLAHTSAPDCAMAAKFTPASHPSGADQIRFRN